jgi:hypothetical protein
VLGVDERELAAIFTVQTAGEALNYHPHLHGLLADGYWKDGVFTSFGEVDLKAIEDAFAETILSQLHKQELISDDDVVQILSQDHTGFGVWLGDPSTTKRASSSSLATSSVPLSRLRGSQYRTTSLPIPPKTVQPTSLMLWSFLQHSRRIFLKPTSL